MAAAPRSNQRTKGSRKSSHKAARPQPVFQVEDPSNDTSTESEEVEVELLQQRQSTHTAPWRGANPNRSHSSDEAEAWFSNAGPPQYQAGDEEEENPYEQMVELMEDLDFTLLEAIEKAEKDRKARRRMGKRSRGGCDALRPGPVEN